MNSNVKESNLVSTSPNMIKDHPAFRTLEFRFLLMECLNSNWEDLQLLFEYKQLIDELLEEKKDPSKMKNWDFKKHKWFIKLCDLHPKAVEELSANDRKIYDFSIDNDFEPYEILYVIDPYTRRLPYHILVRNKDKFK